MRFLLALWKDEEGNYIENIMWIVSISAALLGLLLGLNVTIKGKAQSVNDTFESLLN